MPIHDIWQVFSNLLWLGFKKVMETIFIEKHVFSTKDPNGMYRSPEIHRQPENFWSALRQEIFPAWNFRDFAVGIWNRRNLAATLKCGKIQFLDQNTKLRCHKKNPWKIYMWKQHATKIYFSPETYQLQTFFRSKFYFLDERKKQT